jgi:cellulose synthase/poly-beta-1,6-N-acetylglucosamine synthase-like glycosyltransferase
MEHILDIIMIPIQVVIVFFTLYYFILAVFGLTRKKEKKNLVPKHTFAIVICAHNEERVIGQLIEKSEDTQLSEESVRYLRRC